MKICARKYNRNKLIPLLVEIVGGTKFCKGDFGTLAMNIAEPSRCSFSVKTNR